MARSKAHVRSTGVGKASSPQGGGGTVHVPGKVKKSLRPHNTYMSKNRPRKGSH